MAASQPAPTGMDDEAELLEGRGGKEGRVPKEGTVSNASRACNGSKREGVEKL